MTSPAPIALYYWPTPNGWKISIMLEELGAPYEVHYVDIGKGEQFDADFLAIAPNNRMPAVIDPDGPGGKPVSVFESGAILMYLGRKFGRFYPLDDERARIEVEEWLMWQMGNVGPMLGQNHHFRPSTLTSFPTSTHGASGCWRGAPLSVASLSDLKSARTSQTTRRPRRSCSASARA